MDELTLALERFDLAAYVKSQGAERAGRNEWLIDCPVCMKPKLSVNVVTKFWHCFICEKYERGPDGVNRPVSGAGNTFQLVKWVEQLTPGATALKVIEFAKPRWLDPSVLEALPPERDDSIGWQRVPSGLPEGCLAIREVLPYMARRGISLDDAYAFGLGVSHHGWVAGRIIFPVWSRGQCIYWQARAMWDREEQEVWWPGTKFRKTLNPSVYYCSRCHRGFPEGATRCTCGMPPQYGSRDVLLNLEQAAAHPRVAICEGPTSAIRAGPSAVATFGKQLHPQQIAALVSAGVRRVDFLWDGPSPSEPRGAWPEMMAAAAQLAPHVDDLRLVFLPRGDPGEWSRDDLNRFRAHARPYDPHGSIPEV